MGLPPIHAVCLDAYGTLCRIGERRAPYLALFRLLGVDPRPAARLAMTTALGIEELARVLAPGHDADLSEVRKDLEAEVSSVTLFDDAATSLGRLCRLGVQLWVASNLAPPYAAPLTRILHLRRANSQDKGGSKIRAATHGRAGTIPVAEAGTRIARRDRSWINLPQRWPRC